MSSEYFKKYECIEPPKPTKMSDVQAFVWQFCAIVSLGLGGRYLWWRWTETLNPEAFYFSVAVLTAETLSFLGLCLFFFDIWRESEDQINVNPPVLSDPMTDDTSPLSIDIFIATFDESPEILNATVADAQAVKTPEGFQVNIYLLDDGSRAQIKQLAQQFGVSYLSRVTNRGFKAGNLKNALLQTKGDFVVICDADTRLFPNFLINTMGYFHDGDVAWVQTPHWFYDIPTGKNIGKNLLVSSFPPLRWFGRSLNRISQSIGAFRDPFGQKSQLFFDVIQRRRNRHGASFCCGAASIQRREAVFCTSLVEQAKRLRAVETIDKSSERAFSWLPHLSTSEVCSNGRIDSPLLKIVEGQPFRFHVSEDLFTSLDIHTNPNRSWKSVYHPQVESRMLSPWSISAWAKQKRKYAAGTYDLIFHRNAPFRTGLGLKTRLHYWATFWSYLSVLWLPIFLFAPVISLLSGMAPVSAYSFEYFFHLLPFFILCEVALFFGCHPHSANEGRVWNIASIPINLGALLSVLRGVRPGFEPTPKTIKGDTPFKYVWANILLSVVMLAAASIGVLKFAQGTDQFSTGFMVVNLFWIGYNFLAISRPIRALLWSAEDELQGELPVAKKPAFKLFKKDIEI